jgi:eukaryotic-like serine/threonine-protein kinase
VRSNVSEGRVVNETRVAEAKADPSAAEPVAPTLISSSGRPAATAVNTEVEALAPATPKRRTGLVAGLAGVALLVVGGAVVYVRSNAAPQEPPAPIIVTSNVPPKPATPQPPVEAPPRAVQPVTPPSGAGAETPGTPSPETQPAGVAEKAPEPASVPPAPENSAPPPGPKVAAVAPPQKSPRPVVKPVVQKARASAQKATLEFRIRPYATVVLDGKLLGQTPLAAVEVPVGPHTVQLINKELGKDVTRSVDVKAGQNNQLKYNLLEN